MSLTAIITVLVIALVTLIVVGCILVAMAWGVDLDDQYDFENYPVEHDPRVVGDVVHVPPTAVIAKPQSGDA